MNEKTISKPVIAEIAKASRSIVPWTPLGGGGGHTTGPNMNPKLQ